MATTVYDTLELELMDGTVIQCRPLKIKLLREFMKEFAKMDNEGVREDNDKAIGVLLKCAAVAFKQYKPEFTVNELEDVLDLQTMYKVIEVASGIKMSGDDGGNGAAALGMI